MEGIRGDNLIKSMTGFGRGEYLGDSYNFKIEIKAVNNRYSDISIRMPRYMNFLEEKIKKEIKDEIGRGRVDVYINLEYIDESSLNIQVDLPLAKKSMEALENLTEELDLKENIRISELMNVSDLIKIEREILDEDELWESLKKALKEAVDDIVQMKKVEGNALKIDMLNRLELIESTIFEIEKRAYLVVDEYKDKLEERIEDLLGNEIKIDDERLANEIVIYADKSDVSEELTRLKSHIAQFRSITKEDEPVGRKLDFLIQELNRETNTIGSKSSDIEITQNVVEIKSEIEKIREQVQNVE